MKTNSYHRFAASRPANTSEDELYAVPDSSEINATLYVVNQSDSYQQYSVAVTDASGAATPEDWIIYEKQINGNDTHSMTITAHAGCTVRIKVEAANTVSFNLQGQKIVTT